jgi:hypothetical protein
MNLHRSPAPNRPLAAARRRRETGRILPWLMGIAVILGGLFIGAFLFYQSVGKTPGELLDYAEHRLSGHTRLERFALPMMAYLREQLDAPSAAQRQQMPFIVPPPPALLMNPAANKLARPAGETGRILQVGPSRRLRSIALAAQEAKDGDVVEIDAGNYYGDVAVWNQKRLTIRGIGGRARLHAAGKSAEDKAIWVIRNGTFDISDIDFVGAKVSDQNGAGIRFEDGYLKISHALFWQNENGLLTATGDPSNHSRVDIEDCEFGYNGNGDGYSHAIYIGNIERLRVTGSYFHHGNIGHLIKSRARSTELRYNRITDEAGGRASYEVDIPNGGEAILVGNIIQQDREAANSALISYGQEGYLWPVNRLYLINNTLINDHPYGGAFLRAADGADGIISANNLLTGIGKFHTTGPLTVWNDIRASWNMFERPTRYDYRPSPLGSNNLFKPPPPDLLDRRLLPTRQFNNQAGIGSLPIAGELIHAGALQ